MKFAIVGPESSGKTTLAKQLSALFRGTLVPEVVRELLIPSKGHYIESELKTFCLAQCLAEDEMLQEQCGPYFCDTAPINFYIWSEFKYGRVHEDIQHACKKRQYDLTLLLRPDLAWEDDPLREAPEQSERQKIFDRHEALLSAWGHPFEIVQGQGEARWQNAALQIKMRL